MYCTCMIMYVPCLFVSLRIVDSEELPAQFLHCKANTTSSASISFTGNIVINCPKCCAMLQHIRKIRRKWRIWVWIHKQPICALQLGRLHHIPSPQVRRNSPGTEFELELEFVWGNADSEFGQELGGSKRQWLVISCDILWYCDTVIHMIHSIYTLSEKDLYRIYVLCPGLVEGCNPWNHFGVVPSCFHTTASSCSSGAQSLVSIGPLASEASVSKASVMSHR